jgi:hypothetical protein
MKDDCVRQDYFLVLNNHEADQIVGGIRRPTDQPVGAPYQDFNGTNYQPWPKPAADIPPPTPLDNAKDFIRKNPLVIG